MTLKSQLEVSELRQIAGWLEAAGVGFIEIGRGRNIARLTLELPVRRASPQPAEAANGKTRETRTDHVVARHAGVFLTTHPARSTPLVEIGSRVRAGDTVALLQIAELCLPVVAPADGEVGEWLVEPGAIVGYGTALMVLVSAVSFGASPGGHVLEHREIHRQGAQVRAGAHRRSACPFRAGRRMHLAAPAAGLVEVMLDAACCHQRHLQLLERPDDTQVRRADRPAPARASRAVIDHLIGFRPRHRRARRPRLLPASAFAASAAPLPLGWHPSRQVIGRRRHRGVAAGHGQPRLELRDLGPQLPDRPRQLTDQLIPRRDNARTQQQAAAGQSQATMIRTSQQ